MPEEVNLTSQLTIKIDGADIQRSAQQKLLEVVVDQSTHLPHMFTIRFQDPDLEILDGGGFDLTKTVEITGETDAGQRHTLIKGEITALEPDFGTGMNAQLVVRGYDKLHRLYRETRSTSYLNKKDSDLASQIAQRASLQTQVDQTSTVYKHIYQHNQTDLSFLMQRAWRIGFECFVDDGKLYFRKPVASGSSVELTWGQDLLSFQPRITLAEQVDEVIVKGWDPANQQGIVGRANRGNLYPQVQESRTGAQWAGSFGTGKKVIVDQPVVDQAEADALASARMDELSGSFIVAEGEAFRHPDIRAGRVVNLQGLGQRFSGTYLVTSVTHVYTADGLKQYFRVSGSRMGLLSEQLSQQPAPDRWTGVVPAVVTDADDPEKLGRVKLKYPWMADDVESGWARVMGAGAGNERGLFIIPDVGDEVLVSFVHGDFDQPCILGGLWSSKNKLPPESPDQDKPSVRTWHSRTDHIIAMYDNSENKIDILTSGGRSMTLSDKDSKITIKTSNASITVEDDKITIETGTDMDIKASGSMNLEAQASMKLKANGSLDIETSGNLKIKGSMVQIN